MTNLDDIPFEDVLDGLFSDERVPIHLLYRLSDMRDEQLGQFEREWSGVSADRRAELARHLADIAEENYVVDFSPVFAHLLADDLVAVRLAALDGVWDSDSPALIDPIVDLMFSDADVDVQAAAARALAHYVLLAEWGQVDRRHVSPIVDALLEVYRNERSPFAVRRAALEAMAAANRPAISEIILEAYETGEEEMQVSAIFAMGVTADRRWLPVLFDELSSPSAALRAEAARASGAIGASDAVDRLEDTLDDEDPEVVAAAIQALGQIGGDTAAELLADLAEDNAYEDYFDLIDEALEAMDWMGGELELFDITDDNEENHFPDNGLAT